MPVYIRAEWSGGRAVGVVCLILSLAAVACWSLPFAADLSVPDATPCLIAGGALWIAQLAALAWIGLSPRVGPGRVVLMVSLGLFLIAPVVAFLTSSPIAEALIFLLAYVLNVRVVAGGWRMLFALLVIAGVLMFAGLILEDVEDGAPDASIRTFSDAFVWGLSQVFRFQSLVSVEPVTPAGQVVGAIVIALSVVFAATLLTAIAAWAVGERQRKRADEEQAALLQAVERAVRSAVADALGTATTSRPEEDAGGPGDRRVWLDLDRIAGSSARSLWVERRQAVRELVQRISNVPGNATWSALIGAGAEARLIGLVHGSDLAAEEVPMNSSGSLELMPVTGSTADYIRQSAESGDVIVTSSRDIEAEMAARGVSLVEPAAFVALLSAPASGTGLPTP